MESSAKLQSKQLVPEKLELIDFAFGQFGVRSFADLGGVWRIHGGYTFYALDRFPIQRAVLVDEERRPEVHERAAGYPNLALIEGNFGDPRVAECVGRVDAVLLFDVLVHQAAPDWDAVFSMYADRARCLLVFNPQYRGERTVRLFDLGKEAYFREVPATRDVGAYTKLADTPDATEPTTGRRYRDLHWFWQWGITDDSLLLAAKGLGLRMHYYKNCGRFENLPNFEKHAFVFARS